ncbi:MAG: ribosome biogenesis factor YjgA [Pseudomonadota bacterium]
MKYIITQNDIDKLITTSDDDEELSKSQLKRNIQVLHQFGGALEMLSAKNLKKMNLPDIVLDGLLSAKKMQSDNAKKRQFQYIAKQLHKSDVQAIFKQYIDITQPGEKNKKELFQLERLRDKIIAQGDEAIGDVLMRYPNADRQILRQHIRSIQKEIKLDKPRVQQRKLFKYLRELGNI